MLTPKTHIKILENQSIKVVHKYLVQSNRIKVKLPYDKQYIFELKKIPKHKWLPNEKRWNILFNSENVKKVIGIFSDKKINISSELHCPVNLNKKEQQNELLETNQEVITNPSVMNKVMRLKNFFKNHLEFL